MHGRKRTVLLAYHKTFNCGSNIVNDRILSNMFSSQPEENRGVDSEAKHILEMLLTASKSYHAKHVAIAWRISHRLEFDVDWSCTHYLLISPLFVFNRLSKTDSGYTAHLQARYRLTEAALVYIAHIPTANIEGIVLRHFLRLVDFNISCNRRIECHLVLIHQRSDASTKTL